MTNYSELIRSLKACEHDECYPERCDWFGKYQVDLRCKNILLANAAAAIEELDAEETRLLLVTSDLQDKLMDLQEQLNDADVAADDNGRQVEELQAEVKRLELDNEDYEHEHRRLKGEIEALQAEVKQAAKRNAELHAELERWVSAAEMAGEPKRGKWIIHGEPPMLVIECSVCGQKYFNHVMQEKAKYCSMCGAKMEVQDGSKD